MAGVWVPRQNSRKSGKSCGNSTESGKNPAGKVANPAGSCRGALFQNGFRQDFRTLSKMDPLLFFVYFWKMSGTPAPLGKWTLPLRSAPRYATFICGTFPSSAAVSKLFKELCPKKGHFSLFFPGFQKWKIPAGFPAGSGRISRRICHFSRRILPLFPAGFSRTLPKIRPF